MLVPAKPSIVFQLFARHHRQHKHIFHFSAHKTPTSTSIPRPRRTHRRLGIQARRLSRRVLRNTAHVDELVAKGIADDIRVQSLLLSTACEGVDDLECHFRGGTAANTALKGDGGDALTKVEAGDSRLLDAAAGCAAYCCDG